MRRAASSMFCSADHNRVFCSPYKAPPTLINGAADGVAAQQTYLPIRALDFPPRSLWAKTLLAIRPASLPCVRVCVRVCIPPGLGVLEQSSIQHKPACMRLVKIRLRFWGTFRLQWRQLRWITRVKSTTSPCVSHHFHTRWCVSDEKTLSTQSLYCVAHCLVLSFVSCRALLRRNA